MTSFNSFLPQLTKYKISTNDQTGMSFTYSGDLFIGGQSYAVAIGARDLLLNDVVNRSRFYTQYAIPLPTTILLLGSGLIGLAGVMRRFRKG